MTPDETSDKFRGSFGGRSATSLGAPLDGWVGEWMDGVQSDGWLRVVERVDNTGVVASLSLT